MCASKTGTDHDATAVTFFALDKHSGRAPLLILDWDIAQIEGALLETWLPMVFDRLEELSTGSAAPAMARLAYGSRTRTPELSCYSRLSAGNGQQPPLIRN